MPPSDGENYYFTPTNLNELKAAVADAQQKGVTVRASGQRHSQSPLVADDNRNDPPPKPRSYVVDMSCYVDVGENGIELGPGDNQVTVNPGVREDDVDTFLTKHDLMFVTVTAGGFFSLGGMVAVDVHGATVHAPIFAETASSFVILGADGNLTTIDATLPLVDGWSPLQFARVSLGALGIATAGVCSLGVTHVALESTGVYWRPVFNILEEEERTLLLVNPQHMRAVPGKKTDVRDSEWLADLLRHGLLRASFIPPAPIRAIRELTRYRTAHQPRRRLRLRCHPNSSPQPRNWRTGTTAAHPRTSNLPATFTSTIPILSWSKCGAVPTTSWGSHSS